MNEREQMEFFHEIFDPSLPRLGPGEDASTLRALDMAGGAPPESGILDVGCGNGRQTILLAQNTEAVITALDNYPPYLEELERRAAAAGLSGRIETRLCDMNEMEAAMEPSSLDLIWCEGALFVMGFRAGLEACMRMLSPGGVFAASDLFWFQDAVPDECREYFESRNAYFSTVEVGLETIDEVGFELLGHFPLPESAWIDGYLRPLGKRLAELRASHAGEPAKLEMLDMIQPEIGVYDRYSAYYGYEFFVMRRPS